MVPGNRDTEIDSDGLIYDWNNVGRRYAPFGAVEFFDETLRDGIQNPSVRDPSIGDKLEILHLMASVGIHVADIGLPGASQRAFDDVLRLCREVVEQKLPGPRCVRGSYRGFRHHGRWWR